MAIEHDYLGYKYDTKGVPAFVIVNEKFVIHKATNRMLDRTHIRKGMTQSAYVLHENEVGYDSEWLYDHFGFGDSGGIDVGGGGSDTVTATVTEPAGGIQDGTLTISGITVDGVEFPEVTVTITEGMTPSEAATAIAAALDGLQDAGGTLTISATADGADVIITEAGGGLFGDGITVTFEEAPPVYEDAAVNLEGGGTAELTITVSGAGEDGANPAYLNITDLLADGNIVVGVSAVTITQGDNPTSIATKVASMLDGLMDSTGTVTISADSTDTVVTVTGATAFDIGVAAEVSDTAMDTTVAPEPDTLASASVSADGSATATVMITNDTEGSLAGTMTTTGLSVSGTAIDGVTDVAVSDGDTVANIASALASMLDGLQDTGATLTINASAVGPSVTITEVGGGLIDATLDVVIA